MSIISYFLVTLSLVILMNKKSLIIIAIVISLLIGAGIFIFSRNATSSPNQSNYEANRTSFENKSSNEITQGITESKNEKHITEEQIATFSTPIYSSDPARQNNINISCNTLNETIVKNGETFSFCETVGQASSSKGYQKADIFDRYGNKKKGLGGGNCQISSTLYNAVLSVPSLVVTERHAHSNYVPYIARGKDAAVAYGSYDLKFRNDSGNDIKILASSDGSTVTTTLVSLK